MLNEKQTTKIYIFQVANGNKNKLNHIIFQLFVTTNVTRQIKFMKIPLFHFSSLTFNARWRKKKRKSTTTALIHKTNKISLKLEVEIFVFGLWKLLKRKLESISIHNDNCLFA